LVVEGGGTVGGEVTYTDSAPASGARVGLAAVGSKKKMGRAGTSGSHL
jgi:hypothetical protein